MDEVLFYGKGAGSLPTATSVLADVVEVLRRKVNGSAVETFGRVRQPISGIQSRGLRQVLISSMEKETWKKLRSMEKLYQTAKVNSEFAIQL